MSYFNRFAMAAAMLAATSGVQRAAARPRMSRTGRVTRAARAEAAPKLDGRLDDECWSTARALRGFNSNQMRQDKPPAWQSVAYVCYDETYLYLAMKCLTPEGTKLAGENRGHDSNVFKDDSVEIMIDPGRSGVDYYQLVLNAYGGTFDASRLEGGKAYDEGWNGDWQSATHIGEGYWSVELAIPFHNLGVRGEIGSTWRINFCRNTVEPKELSSLADDGTFNDPSKFVAVKGIEVDFSRYLFEIDSGQVRLDDGAGGPTGTLFCGITNLSGMAKELRVERYAGGKAAEAQTVTLEAGDSYALACESLALEAVSTETKDYYLVLDKPKTERVTVSDAETGTVLATGMIRAPVFCEAMRVRVVNPWRRNPRGGRTETVRGTIETRLSAGPPEGAMLIVVLRSRKTGRVVASQEIASPAEVTEVVFKSKRIAWGAYEMFALLERREGGVMASAKAMATILPGEEHEILVLNNLVSELMNANDQEFLYEREIAFMNPRDGWVYIRGDAKMTEAGRLRVSIDKAREMRDVIVLDGEAGLSAETMRYLEAGRHVLKIARKGDAALKDLIVRSVPEMMYSIVGRRGRVPGWGVYDDAYLAEHVLPNVNVLDAGGSGKIPQPLGDAWIERGGKWIIKCRVPDYGERQALTVETAYGFVAETPGFNNARALGSLADEFGNSEPFCANYAAALRKLKRQPAYRDKMFYPYANHLYMGAAGREFMSAIVDTGSTMMWKRYLKTQANEKVAREFLQKELVARAREYQRLCPESMEHISMVLGHFSTLGEHLSTNPSVDYKVHLEMEFQIVANDPAFWGTYGLNSYVNSYTSEEIARWVMKLFRHYGIEGRRSRVSKGPYDLRHLRNPDFAEGLRRWKVIPAEAGSVRADRKTGFGFLTGRYPFAAGEGDTALVMRRSAERPNVASQVIRKLVPGRLYSLSLYAADFGDLAKKQQVSLNVSVDNVSAVEGKSLWQRFYSIPSHPVAPYGKERPAWMTFHWRVFRAERRRARLTISDWAEDGKPGGPAGQELMFNYISVQPYFDE